MSSLRRIYGWCTMKKRTTFECTECGKVFAMLSQAHIHVLRVHLIPNSKTSYNMIKAKIEVL